MLSWKHMVPSLAALALALQGASVAAAAPHGSAGAPAFVDGAPSMAGLHDVGPVRPATTIHLAFNLRYQHENELDQDIALMSDSKSPMYHRFVSNSQWNAYFAPSPSSLRSVVGLLQRAGFTVTSISKDRGLVDAHAPASTVVRYFTTQLRRVQQPGAGERYVHSTPATLPAELRPLVSAVTGLNNLELYHARPLSKARGASPDKIRGPARAPDGGLGPKVLANGYKFPVQKGVDGTGHTVGITIAGDILDSDLAAYLAYFKIKQTGTVSRIPIDGAHFSGAEVETTLDVETISGLAPGVNIDIYQFPDWTVQFINDTFSQVVNDNIVDSFSNSWAWCETADGSLWDNASIHKLFKHAVAKGITPIFSSGDDGAFTRGCSGLAVASPADDPYVVGVGGLSITANQKGKLTAQSGWDGSGGGVSTIYATPKYQKGVPNVLTTGRNVPDISLPADVEDAYYIDGGWNGPIGGTSWSAPAFNAMLVEIDQSRGTRAGQINAALYKAAAASGSAVFTDILTGGNGSYDAGPGYDQVTGLGAPVGTGLASNL